MQINIPYHRKTGSKHQLSVVMNKERIKLHKHYIKCQKAEIFYTFVDLLQKFECMYKLSKNNFQISRDIQASCFLDTKNKQ